MLALIALALLSGPSHLSAQVLTGELDGSVRDSSGAVVPGAVVTVTNTDQKIAVRMLKTDHLGQFTAPLLAIGNYSVTVTAQGFDTYTVAGLEVHVGQPSAVPIVLSVGSVAQSVDVTASIVGTQLDSTAAGTLINTEQVTQLSLSSRNFLQLMSIQPGISGNIPQSNERGNIKATGAVNTQAFSVNGNATNTNGYFLDGADTLKRAGQQPVTFASVDFIQEINLLRGSYGADVGGPGAAAISVQTKSGAATFHGGAFGFFRRQIFNANDYFSNMVGLPRATSRYNDFGYYIGGPIWIPGFTKRETAKTFFFFGQEFLRSENTFPQTISNIPTAAQRAGIFSTPVCVAYYISGPQAGQCQTSTKSITAFDPTAQAYLNDIINKVQLPNSTSDPQGLTWQAPGTNNENQTFIRIDRQFTRNLSGFFRYLDDPFNLIVPNGFQQTSLIPGVATTAMTDGSTSWLGHATYVLGTNHVFEGGYSQRSNWVTAVPISLLLAASSPDIQINLPYTSVVNHLPSLKIGASNYSVASHDERAPLRQVFLNNTNTLGRHTLKAGFNLEFELGGGTNGVANGGTFTFSNTPPPGSGTSQFAQAFASFLVGKPANFTQTNIDAAAATRANIYEGFVQDDIHLTSRLTTMVGVRYTYFAPPSNAVLPGHTFSPALNFDQNTFSLSKAPTIDSKGLICTSAPCAGGKAPNPNYDPLNGIIKAGATSPYGDAVSHAQEDDFAPRVGFSLDVFGNGATALRGGYGIYYISTTGNPSTFATNQDPPNVVTTTISTPSFANPASGVATLSATPSGLQGYKVSGKGPYSEQYSLDLQQQLAPGLVIDIGYYGNHGVHQDATIDLNQPPAGQYTQLGIPGGTVTAANTPYLNQLRPYPGYSFITFHPNSFKSNYNSLQTSLRGRFRGGTIFTVNYTFSKSLTNARTPQNNADLAPEYGPTDFDRNDILNASLVYPVPFYHDQKGLIGHVLGGFELSGIVTIGSGTYNTVTVGAVDPGGLGLLAGPATARPDILSNPNASAPHTFSGWFNSSAFQYTPANEHRPGNDPVANVLGPGYQVWNLSLFKNVRTRENYTFQLRAEAFNVFNHTNFNGIGTTFGLTSFGLVTSAGDPRNLQLGAKLTF